MSKDLDNLKKNLEESKEFAKDHDDKGVAFAFGYLTSAVENYISNVEKQKGGEEDGK